MKGTNFDEFFGFKICIGQLPVYNHNNCIFRRSHSPEEIDDDTMGSVILSNCWHFNHPID